MTYAIVYGCRVIRSVNGLIGYGCGMIYTGSDVVDGLIVNAISGSSDGNVNC